MPRSAKLTQPFVLSNLAISIDGKIATQSREFFPLGTPLDRKQMIKIRKRSDVLVMGAGTLRTYGKACTHVPLKSQPRKKYVNAVITSDLAKIPSDLPFFKDHRINRIVYCTSAPAAADLNRLSSLATVVPIDGKKDVAPQMIADLHARGLCRILVEGGGDLMWEFVKHNLIDRYHLTVTPRVLGGTESPTLVDGPGFKPADVVNLTLKQCKKVGDELYLIYDRVDKRGA